MKMKSADINVLFANLSALANKKLPVKVSYAVSRNLNKLQSEMEIAERERIKLCEQMAKKDKDGNPIKITENGSEHYDIEDMSALVAAVEELRNTEIDVDIVMIQQTVEELLDLIDMTPDRYDALTPSEIMTLERIAKTAE